MPYRKKTVVFGIMRYLEVLYDCWKKLMTRARSASLANTISDSQFQKFSRFTWIPQKLFWRRKSLIPPSSTATSYSSELHYLHRFFICNASSYNVHCWNLNDPHTLSINSATITLSNSFSSDILYIHSRSLRSFQPCAFMDVTFRDFMFLESVLREVSAVSLQVRFLFRCCFFFTSLSWHHPLV